RYRPCRCRAGSYRAGPPGGIPAMADPLSRLQFARDEIDRVFGSGYAAAHPEVVAAGMGSAASDYAAHLLAPAITGIAPPLAGDGDNGGMVDGIVRAPASLLRP